MKKILSIVTFLLLIYFILSNSVEIMESIKLSFSICINNLFPSLIPFMLLSNLLINYNFIDDLSDIFNKIMTKIFRVNKNCSFALIMSIMSGTPSNAKYLKDLFNNKLISIKDVKKCLNFCHFTNPIFILGTIGYTFLGNKKMGLIILISHYLSAIIIGLFNKKDNDFISIESDKINSNNNFINILKQSINSTIDTLFLILGIITTCLIVTCILNNIINLDNNYKFVYGLIEITQGLKYLSLSNFSIEIKTILSSFFISFGGLCIHAQVFSILDNKKIRYLPYFSSRLIHGILSSILTYLLIRIF
ncbi:MAG: hypothetical protein IJY25_00155 [Bacilli bacterium]|nr:hypothetical protein [Bacilli bacterium]